MGKIGAEGEEKRKVDVDMDSGFFREMGGSVAFSERVSFHSFVGALIPRLGLFDFMFTLIFAILRVEIMDDEWWTMDDKQDGGYGRQDVSMDLEWMGWRCGPVRWYFHESGQ